MWKWFLGVFVVLAVLCGAGGYFFAATEQGRGLIKQLQPQQKQTEVRVEPVKRGDLVRVVSAPGLIEPKTKVQISAQVSARIIALPFRKGSDVKKGDIIVRLDPDDLRAALDSAQAMLRGEEARLEGLRAELANATAERNRIKELYDTKDVSKSDLDQAEAGYLRAAASVKSGEHSIETARANVDRAQKNLAFTTIASPIDGTIILLNSEVGEQVLGTFNNAGSVIMEIADLSTMLLKAKVDEANVAPVRAGQMAVITINSYPDRTFKGVVDLVGLKKMTDRDGSGYFETEILVQQDADTPDAERLRSGYQANADIQVQTHAGVLKVPSQAIVDRRVDELPKEIQEDPAVDRTKVFARVVYQFLEGKAKAKPVTIGSSDVTHTVIVSGLTEGDPVITGPFKVLTTLKHDQKVAEEGTQKKGEPKQGEQKSAQADQSEANGKS